MKVTYDFWHIHHQFVSHLSSHLILIHWRKSIKHPKNIEFIFAAATLSGWSAQLHSSVQYLTEHWQWKHSIQFFAHSVIFAHRRWVASRLWQKLWCSHHLQAQCDLLFTTYTHLSVTDVGKQQRATNRRTGTCQHAEHCTLFWHNRNACFPTQALDTKRVLTTVLLDDNREVYVILRLCNQKISTPLFFCTSTT